MPCCARLLGPSCHSSACCPLAACPLRCCGFAKIDRALCVQESFGQASDYVIGTRLPQGCASWACRLSVGSWRRLGVLPTVGENGVCAKRFFDAGLRYNTRHRLLRWQFGCSKLLTRRRITVTGGEDGACYYAVVVIGGVHHPRHVSCSTHYLSIALPVVLRPSNQLLSLSSSRGDIIRIRSWLHPHFGPALDIYIPGRSHTCTLTMNRILPSLRCRFRIDW
jgi:hypothetical protein